MSEETIRRANEARQLLANPLLIEAFERVERDAFEDALKATDVDGRVRDACLRTVIVVRSLRQHLVTVILEGEDAVRIRPTAA